MAHGARNAYRASYRAVWTESPAKASVYQEIRFLGIPCVFCDPEIELPSSLRNTFGSMPRARPNAKPRAERHPSAALFSAISAFEPRKTHEPPKPLPPPTEFLFSPRPVSAYSAPPRQGPSPNLRQRFLSQSRVARLPQSAEMKLDRPLAVAPRFAVDSRSKTPIRHPLNNMHPFRRGNPTPFMVSLE
jgi:hypothetical protein